MLAEANFECYKSTHQPFCFFGFSVLTHTQKKTENQIGTVYCDETGDHKKKCDIEFTFFYPNFIQLGKILVTFFNEVLNLWYVIETLK